MKKQRIHLSDGRVVVIETDDHGIGSMVAIGLREGCPDCGSVDCERTCKAQAKRHDPKTESRLLFNSAVHGIEAFLLALACEGVGVDGPKFGKALQTVLDAIADNYGG